MAQPQKSRAMALNLAKRAVGCSKMVKRLQCDQKVRNPGGRAFTPTCSKNADVDQAPEGPHIEKQLATN